LTLQKLVEVLAMVVLMEQLMVYEFLTWQQ